MKLPTPQNGVPAMSSLEIAKITGKPHGNVMQDIRRILEEAGIGQKDFLLSYLNSQNKSQPCFLLPRRECDLVVSGYSVKYRLAIIDRWHELEAQIAPAMPTTMIEAGKLWIAEMEKTAALSHELAIAAPKVAALDRLTGTNGSECISHAAKVLGVHPSDLFNSLSEMGWIFRRGSSWVAYQEKITAGVMTEKLHTAVTADGTERICAQARITARGMIKLASYLQDENQEAFNF
jgi:phage regulator Rha-like protein